MRFTFADFVLDGDTRELRRSGRLVTLTPKAYDLLELLLRERPRAVSVTRIRALLWPRTHVGATSLHVLVSQLRAALGDNSKDPQWLRTVPRFGYAFCGTASGDEEDASPSSPRTGGGGAFWLATLEGDVPLRPGENVVGREAGASIRIDRSGVSRRHASIRVESGRASIADLGSKNGTFLGGKRILVPTLLQDGDELRLGLRVTVVFRKAESRETATEAEER